MSAISYFEALGLTEAVEAPVYAAVLALGSRVRLRAAVLASVVVNLVSHPLFTFALVPLLEKAVSPAAAVSCGEVIVCLAEAAMLYVWIRRELPMIIVASLLANALSFLAGLLIF